VVAKWQSQTSSKGLYLSWIPGTSETFALQFRTATVGFPDNLLDTSDATA
jgi:hypothetical protein